MTAALALAVLTFTVSTYAAYRLGAHIERRRCNEKLSRLADVVLESARRQRDIGVIIYEPDTGETAEVPARINSYGGSA